jgi:dihydroneopterin aldolase
MGVSIWLGELPIFLAIESNRKRPLNAPTPFTQTDAPSGPARITGLKVFVRALRLDVEIGIYAHEHGRVQPLIIDVELDVLPDLGLTGFEHIHDTVNYEAVLTKARAVAAAGHILLVEAFAQRLAQACLDDNRVLRARVRVDKPEALAPDAQAASVEIVVERA